MSEQSNKNQTKRLKLPKGKQEKFLRAVKKKLDKTWQEMANLAGVSRRTITDWQSERYTMNLEAAKLLSKESGVDIPKNGKVKSRYWYTQKAGRKGGEALLQKYGKVGGDEEYRKKKWQEWWEEEGKFRNNLLGGNMTPEPINEPGFSEDLAEFTGIVLGDGGITERQIVITLHKEDDKEYGDFIVKLIEGLFDVPVSVTPAEDGKYTSYRISRKNLVKFCTDKLSLKKGNKVKQQVEVPEWIKEVNKFKRGCLRGLIDTDGSVYKHCYKVRGKEYCYNKFSFCNRSLPILEFVYEYIQEMGLNPSIYYGKRYEVRVENSESVVKLFQEVGSHNPKHTDDLPI